LRGWISLPLFGRFRLGLSPTRSWISFPIFGGIRGGVSIPHTKRRRKYAIKVKEIGAPKIRTGQMPGALADD
jgi:hypothetical protein